MTTLEINSGRPALHAEQQDTRALLRDELRAIAAEIDPDLWIEKMTLDTSETVALPALIANVEGADADDLFAMLHQASTNPEFLEMLASDLAVFLSTTSPPAPGEDSLHVAVRKGEWARHWFRMQVPPCAHVCWGHKADALRCLEPIEVRQL